MSTMTPEDVQKKKYSLWREDQDIELESVGNEKRIVAEGDSWFDYPPGLDILDHLKDKYNYKIKKLAHYGDTLENMVFGSEIKNNFTRIPPQFLETLEAIRNHNPKAVLISAGGNDIAGDQIDSFLNHKDSGLQPLRQDYCRYVIDTVYKNAFEYFMSKVWSINPSVHIITHGYGHAIPDGRGVLNIFDLHFIGPWLRPALSRKNIMDLAEGKQVIRNLIDIFNDMLKDLDNANPNFHYLDLRPIIADFDWINELHLYGDAYEKVAELFHQKITSL